jgi:hypothetical protein
MGGIQQVGERRGFHKKKLSFKKRKKTASSGSYLIAGM